MFKQTLIAAAAIALFAAATTPALAQSAGAPPADKAGAQRMYGYELMTPEERQAYMDRMRNAKTPEERTKLRDEHRAEMQKRAKDKGVTLAEPRGPGGPGGGPRGGPGGSRGQMYGEQLFSQQERDDYRKRMQEAKTPEDRAKIRDEVHATAQTRAKEKGITLPEPRGPGGPGGGPHGGPGGGRGQMYGEQLFSQQERDDYRKRMQEAKTPEDRAKIRDEARALADGRAKEKGITLPEPRGPRGPGPGPGAPKAQPSGS
jgi:Spy/CpxP family protein refolding chaperone